jgi:2-keto-4-pentenoate hydratase
MGDPLVSVAWLVNKLAEYEVALEAGMRVMSGSFTRQFAVASGDRVRSVFLPYGAVEATFD